MSGRLSPGLECPATAHSQWVEEGLERQTEGSSAGFIACYLTQVLAAGCLFSSVPVSAGKEVAGLCRVSAR